MKERKLTVNLVWANIFSIVIFAIVAIITVFLWRMLWSEVDVLATIREDKDDTVKLAALLVLFIGGIFVHELIHGLTWAHYARDGWKSISFGVVWKMLTPYCHCDVPLMVRPYIIGGLMPLVVMGIIPWVVGLCIGSLWTTVFGVFYIVAAAGDILIVWKLRGEKPTNTVLDHPTEAGCIIYEE